jgi:hypothetical protein
MKRLEAGSFPLPPGDGKKTVDRQGHAGDVIGRFKNRKNEAVCPSKWLNLWQ